MSDTITSTRLRHVLGTTFPGLDVLMLEELERLYMVHAEVTEPPLRCTHCNCTHFVKFGSREESIKDLPRNGKHVMILLHRRRYRCRSCSMTFLEPVPQKHKKRRMTNRLVQYIELESLSKPFTSVADDVGVDEKTVRNIFHDPERWIDTVEYLCPKNRLNSH